MRKVKEVLDIIEQEAEKELTGTSKLEDLIVRYGDNKTKFDALKKVVDKENNELKQAMIDSNCTEAEGGNYKVSYIVQKRESMNEDMLLNILWKTWTKEHGSEACPWVKMKYEVDMDALENALYHNEFDEDTLAEIAKCKEVKEVPTLRIKVKK